MPARPRSTTRLAGAALALVVATTLVAACGSGSRHADTATTTRPATTTRSPATTTASTSTAAPTPAPTTTPATMAPSSTTTAPARADGPQRDLPTAQATYTFVDASRPTETEGGTRVSDVRTLPTTVWFPATGKGPWPLVVFGHGFQVGPAPYARICEKWASAGYVVAAPSFELSDESRAGQYLDESDMIHQPADMSFVITQLLARSTQPAGSDPLSGLIDASRIAAAGHSDGATDALAVGYYPGLSDPRVRAIVALSADPFPDRDSATGSAVLLDVHGDADTVTPFANSGRIMDQIQAHRFQLVLQGADHLPPVAGGTPWTPVLDAVTIDFLDRYLAGRTTTDDALVTDGDQPGVASITSRS